MVRTVFGLFDELFTLFSVLFALLILLQQKTKKSDYRELKILIVFQMIGLIGSLIYQLQPAKVVVLDLMATSKFVLIFWSSLLIFRELDIHELLEKIKKFAKVLATVFFVSSFSSFLRFPAIFLASETRFGLRAFKFIFFHPFVLAMAVVSTLSILLLTSNQLKENRLYSWLLLLPLLLTLRSRSFGFVLIFLLIYLYLKTGIKIGRIGLFVSGAIALSGLFLLIQLTGSFDKYYGGGVESARGILTEDAFAIAKETFPIGKGLATFGTFTARTYYSPLYSDLGYRQVYGLGYIHTQYLTDSFWPAILGQYGYLGLGTYVGLLASLCTRGVRLLKQNGAFGLAFCLPLIHLVISSTSSNSFFNPMAVGYAFIMALATKLSADFPRQ
ncbi:hypothetical protein [Candidatus Enterococcus courvalinii]|uniref:Uncharacterized protein n=1 Tax=Candidatus Enterococcus courvalinii TaxID=2815329 RepID=A0ABS3HX16_9ENTE|nr:hypothetical protein [Enterococcus sp. MSG2901]MBO0481013.1 hypothetical protein [Enterococcus sp. MSG2901]